MSREEQEHTSVLSHTDRERQREKEAVSQDKMMSTMPATKPITGDEAVKGQM